MLSYREEIFGPILAIYTFDSEEEVIKSANDTNMGLAAYFWTENTNRTWRLLESLEAGMIGMNTGMISIDFLRDSKLTLPTGNASCAESPFGGLKESGYGKEAGKDVAIEEYLVAKTGTLTLR